MAAGGFIAAAAALALSFANSIGWVAFFAIGALALFALGEILERHLYFTSEASFGMPGH